MTRTRIFRHERSSVDTWLEDTIRRITKTERQEDDVDVG